MNHCHTIVLNWNAAHDTIECLQSLIEHRVRSKIIVVDNHSADQSAAEIYAWATASFQKCISLTEDEADQSTVASDDYDFVLLRNRENYGFAGGNNTAIRFAAPRSRGGVIWLLNNDARVNGTTFPALLQRMASDAKLGFVGSIIRHYDEPDVIQCFGGGIIHRWLGKRSLYGKGLPVELAQSLDDQRLDYLMGASLAIRTDVIFDVGLMEDAYFMYAEELDWQLRAKKKGWKIGVARESSIFHKGAASTQGRSHMFHYYLNRASVMFSTRFFGRASLLTVVPALFSIILIQNWRRPRNVWYGWKGVKEGAAFRWSTSQPVVQPWSNP